MIDREAFKERVYSAVTLFGVPAQKAAEMAERYAQDQEMFEEINRETLKRLRIELHVFVSDEPIADVDKAKKFGANI